MSLESKHFRELANSFESATDFANHQRDEIHNVLDMIHECVEARQTLVECLTPNLESKLGEASKVAISELSPELSSLRSSLLLATIAAKHLAYQIQLSAALAQAVADDLEQKGQ